MKNFAGGNFFSLFTNSSFKLKMNICRVELSILFSKDLLFLNYIQVTGFWFFWGKLIFIYISLFYFTLDMSLISWCFHFNFLVDLIKSQKCKKRLKYFARIKFCKQGKLKLGKLCFLGASCKCEKLLIFWIKTFLNFQ